MRGRGRGRGRGGGGKRGHGGPSAQQAAARLGDAAGGVSGYLSLGYVWVPLDVGDPWQAELQRLMERACLGRTVPRGAAPGDRAEEQHPPLPAGAAAAEPVPNHRFAWIGSVRLSLEEAFYMVREALPVRHPFSADQ